MSPLDLVQLTALMDRTSGRAEVSVGLIDGPVLLTHPELVREPVRASLKAKRRIGVERNAMSP